LRMDSVDDLLQLLRNYFLDDFLPTKILHLRHDSVKITIYSDIDTVIRLRIERRNRGYEEKVINLVEGLNALCLCPTFPYSYHDRGLTRDKIKNRPDSGVTVSLLVGPIPHSTFVANNKPIDPKFRENDTFKNVFIRRHGDSTLTETIVLSVNDSLSPFLHLCVREIALQQMDCSSFLSIMKGKLNVGYRADYKKYSWTKQMTSFMDLRDLPLKTHKAYRRYTDRCYDHWIWHGHSDSVSSSYDFPPFIW